ncbi:MAG: phage tail protein [Myxococcota bacterium]|jgi:phage tail-like protein|nr:phage tail protein [Myxococcota bacterium]
MAANSSDPFGTFAFKVSIGGIASGYFQEVSGLSAQIEVVEVQEGGRNNTTRKLVGQGKFPNLVLKRGFCTATLLDALLDFHGSKKRLNGTISMYSNAGKKVAEWQFVNGIPVKWDGPQLNVGQNAIAVESLEIAHEGIESHMIGSLDRSGQ